MGNIGRINTEKTFYDCMFRMESFRIRLMPERAEAGCRYCRQAK